MQLLKVEQKDKQKWDEFIEQNNVHIFQSFEYGDIRAGLSSKIINIEPLRYFIYENEDIIGIVQIFKVKFSFLSFSFFYSPRGPFFLKHDRQNIVFFVKEIKKLAKQYKTIFLKIDPDVLRYNTKLIDLYREQNFFIPKHECHIFGTQPKTVFRLDITKPLAEIEQNFHYKTRYNIKIARNKGVVIKEGNLEYDFDRFYQLFRQNNLRKNNPVFKEKYYLNLLNIFGSKKARLFIAVLPDSCFADNKDRIIGGVIVYFIGKRIWYGYGAFDLKWKKKFPNNLLHYEIIKWAKQNRYEEYDLRGTGILDEDNICEEDPLYGIYKFKKGFTPVFTKLMTEHDLIFNRFLYFFWQKSFWFLKLIKMCLAGKKNVSNNVPEIEEFNQLEVIDE